MTKRSPHVGSLAYQEGWDAGHAVGYAKGRAEVEAEYLASELAVRRAAVNDAVMAKLRETLADLDARWTDA